MKKITLTKFNKNLCIDTCKLYMTVFNSAPWLEKWTIDSSQRRIKYFLPDRNKDTLAFVYKVNNVVLGFIGGTFKYFEKNKLFHVDEFFIKPEFQRKGIGTKILKKLETKLIQDCVDRIDLRTLGNSYVKRFYLDRGYSPKSSDRIYLEKNLQVNNVAVVA